MRGETGARYLSSEIGFSFFVSEPTETSIQQAREKNMKTLKKLGAAIALTFALAFTAFADCAPPVPGEILTPPCSVAQITPDDPVASAEPSASSTSGGVEISVTTLDVLLSALSLF